MSATSTPRRRHGRALRALAALAVLLGVAGYLATQYVMGGAGPARCTVRASGEGEDGDGAEYRVRPEQAVNAATIEAVASSRELPERAVTIAVATAIQESGLRNISHGDRDSLGLFQQRPSQGWGSEREILDPVYASGKFYDHLVEVPGYSRLPLTVAAQKVQRSGFPQAYAKHEANAALLASALTGRRAAALNCTTGPGGIDRAGDPEAVRKKLAREFGEDVLRGSGPPSGTADTPAGGGEQPGAEPVDGGDTANGGDTAARTAATEAADPEVVLSAPTRKRGWELTHWALAHWEELRIDKIAYDGREWTADRSEEGWRETDDEEAGGGRESVVLGLATEPS
ncbi:heavy metal transporter [Streptomyces sp. Z26]|uniref:heavy metal transporter n=1 Tax=Streptomyces sp. Z26 TaxID=2500177 RepID=UPI000EF1490F|nr:heavy metal transporter [Streptomyces sp. Z26]RLL68757.1 heavy metal transporter [Streptomyces sp. Z26]